MSKLKLDLHDIYNKGFLIDKALNDIIEEAIEKKKKKIAKKVKKFYFHFLRFFTFNLVKLVELYRFLVFLLLFRLLEHHFWAHESIGRFFTFVPRKF